MHTHRCEITLKKNQFETLNHCHKLTSAKEFEMKIRTELYW